MKSVYLCGPITGLTVEGARAERQKVGARFRDHGIEVLTPMRGKICQPESRDEVMAAKGLEQVVMQDKAIVYRDRNDVMRADLVLANLIGARKASIGSMIEYGWADAFRVPVVTVMERQGNLHDHAFVHQLSTYVVEDLDEAIDLSLILLNAGNS